MSLFDEFPKTSKEDWPQMAQKAIRSDDLSVLNWYHDPEILLLPYYDQYGANPSSKHHFGMPRLGQGWVNIEPLTWGDQAGQQALEALNMGAGGILLEAKSTVESHEAINDILPEHCWVGLRLSKGQEGGANIYKAYLDSRNANVNDFKGLVSMPMVQFAETKLHSAPDFGQLQQLMSLFEAFPHVGTIELRADQFQMVGATPTHQLAYLLAEARWVLEGLVDQGCTHLEVAQNLVVTLAFDRDFYHEIAKVRSARLLLFKLFAAYGIEINPNDIFILGITSPTSDTFLDAHTNYLRKTTQAMAAAIGGVDGLIVHPYEPNGFDGFARRITRNISNILKEESYLDKVADPLAGSYYINALTEQLAEKAWGKFTTIEKAGGLLAYSEKGHLAFDLNRNMERIAKALSQRKSIMVGVNDFPNSLQKLAGINYSNEHNHFYPASILEKFHRALANMSKAKPVISPVLLGEDVVMKSARLNFAINFLGCGGFDVGEPKSVDQMLKSTQQDIVVLCGADVDYAMLTADQVGALKSKARLLVIAGYPIDKVDQLSSFGIDMFIHRNSDLTETIGQIFKSLGIELTGKA